MAEIIRSRCTGQVSEFLIELWKINVNRNEEISHKRWQSTATWLTKYEEDFVREYVDMSPFLNKGNRRKNFQNYQQQQQQNYQQHQQQQQQRQQQPQPYRARGTYADAVRRPVHSNGNLQQLINTLISTLNNQQPAQRRGTKKEAATLPKTEQFFKQFVNRRK